MGRGRQVALAGALVLATTAGCGATRGGDGRLSAVAGFYPLQYVTEQVGGDRVTVTNLSQPGAEPHDLELSPRQVAAVADATLVVYLPGFQPELDEAVDREAADSALNVADVVPLLDATSTDTHDEESGAHADAPEGEPEEHAGGEKDPHFWLDPTRLATVAQAVADRLATADPDGAAGYRERAASLTRTLNVLDHEYREELSSCERREIVVSHAAFGYLADRYRLEQIGITGLSPETEPTPQRLAEVTAAARHHNATTIFFETLVSPRVAEAIATEVGAGTAVLDPIEGLPPGSSGDYVSVMRANLAALGSALGCT